MRTRKRYSYRSAPLLALILAAGCAAATAIDSLEWPTRKPAEDDIVGTWVLAPESVKLARAKGVPEWKVIWQHGLRNAIIPVVTFTVIMFAYTIASAIIVETVFTWPGVGRLLIDAVFSRDFPVVQAGVLLLGLLFVFGNLFCDVLYAVADPRIRKR